MTRFTTLLVSIGLFYKDIGTFIQTLRTELPYNQTGLPLNLIPANFTCNELFLVTAGLSLVGFIPWDVWRERRRGVERTG